MPGQNTPATTTMATIEQGMKVFTAIYKRVYRAMSEELYKLFKLNEKYLDPQTETAVLDEPIGPEEFDNKNYDVCPAADPAATSKQEKLAKAQALMEIGGQLGTLNKIKVTQRVLEAMEEPNWQDLVSQQGPPPDPKVEALKIKSQIDQQKAQMDMAKSQQDMALSEREAETKLKMEAAMTAQKIQGEQEMAQTKMGMAKMQMQAQGMKEAMGMQQNDQKHKQKMMHSEAEHKKKMAQQPKEKKGKP